MSRSGPRGSVVSEAPVPLSAPKYAFGRVLIDLARNGVVDYFVLFEEFSGLFNSLILGTVKDT